MSRTVKVFSLLVFIALLLPRPSHAYIDPGTGSYVFQILIAGFLGVIVSVKMFWKQISLTIKNLLNSFHGKNNQEK